MSGDRWVISVEEAAELRKVTREAIAKAVRVGRYVAYPLSHRGLMLSRDQILGKKISEDDFFRNCQKWVCVPDACEIMRVTDAAVIRKIKSGVVHGFRLNGKSWAVLRASAEREYRDYLRDNVGRAGRKRHDGSRSPRTLIKQRKLDKQKNGGTIAKRER